MFSPLVIFSAELLYQACLEKVILPDAFECRKYVLPLNSTADR
jgi:hypothetical protein